MDPPGWERRGSSTSSVVMADQSASIGVATAIRAPSLTTTLTRIKPKEIGALTGLRGAAALWVVIFHLASEVGAVAGPAAL